MKHNCEDGTQAWFPVLFVLMYVGGCLGILWAVGCFRNF